MAEEWRPGQSLVHKRQGKISAQQKRILLQPRLDPRASRMLYTTVSYHMAVPLSDFSSAQLTTQTSTSTVPAPAGREQSPSRAQFLTVSFFLEDSGVFRRWLGCSPLWVGWLCLLVQCVICSHVTEGSVANALCLWPVTFKYCCSPQGCLFPPAPFSQDQVSTGATCQIH